MGWIAFEMARQLQQAGEIVDILLLIDQPAPLTSSVKKAITGVPFLFRQALPEIWPYVADYLRQHWQPDSSTMTAPPDSSKFPAKISSWGRRLSSSIESIGSLGMVFQANTQAMLHYTPSFYDGKIILLRTYRSVGGSQAQELTLNWQQFSSQTVEVHFVPGRHLTLLRSPHLQQLAETLQTCLQEPE